LKGFFVQNFFGFIDYEKNSSSYKKNSSSMVSFMPNRELIYREYANYNLSLSYDTNKNSDLIESEESLLLFNGTIFNQSSLREEVGSLLSSSTVEFLVLCYKKWGVDLLKRVEGKFSLIIFDKREEQLILAKDKVGVLPLNFYYSKDLIIFGSRVSDFKEAPGFTPTISPEGLALYLQFGYIIQPNTIFDGCYKVKSGELTFFDLSKREYFNHAYWKLESLYEEEKFSYGEDTIVQEAHTLLKQSLQKTEVASEPVALSLSGGYDSSTLAALLKRESGHRVESFTIGFEERCINEAPYAKEIAKYLGIAHHEYYFKAEDALRIIPKLSEVYDEPFADHAASPTLLTAELIREEGIDNLFIGDGGDEVFATADDVHFFQRIQQIPKGLRAALVAPLKRVDVEKIPYFNTLYNLPTKCDKFLEILSADTITQMTETRTKLFREKELQRFVKGYGEPRATTFNEICFNGSSETVDEIIGTYFKTSMIDGELVKSYSATNHQNIHISTPFLDEKLIAYMARVPSDIKIKEGIKKYILKEIAHQHIPKSLLDRPKSGFDIPFSLWMREELKDLVYDQINEKRLNEENIFYTSSIIKLRDDFYEGNNNYKYKLWRVFIFQLWYEKRKG
jgi:asparagine synthase (glutamine-hydrolysing)